MIKIKLDGVGNHLWQWDVNRRLVIEGLSAGTDIHFSNTSFCDSNALITEVYEEDGQMYAPIPNILLQQEGKLYIYPYLENDEGKYTMTRCQISITGRAKPDDYIYTETEYKEYNDFADRVKVLENTLSDSNQIAELIKADMLPAVYNYDKMILTDENGNVILRY